MVGHLQQIGSRRFGSHKAVPSSLPGNGPQARRLYLHSAPGRQIGASFSSCTSIVQSAGGESTRIVVPPHPSSLPAAYLQIPTPPLLHAVLFRDSCSAEECSGLMPTHNSAGRKSSRIARQSANLRIAVRMGKNNHIQAFNAARPQIRRNHIFTKIKLAVHRPNAATPINQHGSPFRRNHQQ